MAARFMKSQKVMISWMILRVSDQANKEAPSLCVSVRLLVRLLVRLMRSA